MTRTYFHQSDGFLKATILTAALTLATFGGIKAASAAPMTDGTAANTTIRNTVTVSYKNNSGTAMTPIVRDVDVTVALVDTTPTLTLVSTTPQSVESGAAFDFQYSILSNANGPDRYNLNIASFAESAGITGSANAFRTATGGGGSAITYVDLGATSVATGTTIAASGTTAITVPRDLTADSTVNGIASGDTVTINNVDYTVASVDDTAQGLGTTTITLNGNGTAAPVVAGELIQEKATFYLRVTAGAATADATITTNINARDAANPGQDAATANSQTVVNVYVPALTVTKYVTNITTAPTAGAGSSVSIDNGAGGGAKNYYTSGVTGKPGETLEYLIEIKNATGKGTAKGIKIADPIPQFTTYTTSSMRLDPGAGTWAALNDNLNGGDAGEWDSTGKNIYIYAGSGGVDTGALANDGTGGNLAAGATTYGSYRVTID